MTAGEGCRWVDHLVERGVAKKSVRDAWIASLKATASFMVERRPRARACFMDSVDIGDLQSDVAPAGCLTSRIDGRGAAKAFSSEVYPVRVKKARQIKKLEPVSIQSKRKGL